MTGRKKIENSWRYRTSKFCGLMPKIPMIWTCDLVPIPVRPLVISYCLILYVLSAFKTSCSNARPLVCNLKLAQQVQCIVDQLCLLCGFVIQSRVTQPLSQCGQLWMASDQVDEWSDQGRDKILGSDHGDFWIQIAKFRSKISSRVFNLFLIGQKFIKGNNFLCQKPARWALEPKMAFGCDIPTVPTVTVYSCMMQEVSSNKDSRSAISRFAHLIGSACWA